MKKLVVLIALCVLLIVVPASAQFTYFPDYFSNNTGVPGASDQLIRIINTGTTGTPISPGEGTWCANIYVFDNNQEMVECCSCPITANGLLTLSVAGNLTANPLTSVVPPAGVVKFFPSFLNPGNCSPTEFGIVSPTGQFSAFATHLQVTGGVTYLTETVIAEAPLNEQSFLIEACSFVRYLGSGKGTCTCPSTP